MSNKSITNVDIPASTSPKETNIISKASNIHNQIRKINEEVDTVGPSMDSIGNNLVISGSLLTAASNISISYGTGGVSLATESYLFDKMRGIPSSTFRSSLDAFMPRIEPKKAIAIVTIAMISGLACKWFGKQLKDKNNQDSVRRALGREE